MRVAMPLRKPVLVTSTDWVKLVGIATFLVDHIGLYFIEDDDLWRIIGRIAAPIFFFLIGFARSRHVPLSWIVWGVLLSGIDYWVDGPDEFALNILLNFALIRLALRGVDRFASTPLHLGVIMLACLALSPIAGDVVEYGAEGWLWALFGYAQRAFRDGQLSFAAPRLIFAAVAALFYILLELNNYEFEGLAALALALVVTGLTLVLLLFDRKISAIQPPPLLAPILVWLSRYSLEIYAVSLFLMQDVFYVFPW